MTAAQPSAVGNRRSSSVLTELALTNIDESFSIEDLPDVQTQVSVGGRQGEGFDLLAFL